MKEIFEKMMKEKFHDGIFGPEMGCHKRG